MHRVKHILTAFLFSFPVRLLIRQIHRHKVMLAFWVLLIGFLSGAIGAGFGGPYLFLEPEYLGKENFWSTFLVGSALGAFLFAYMITFYINESYRFHFIAFTKSPFYTLSFNNMLVPGFFLTLYIWRFFDYHLEIEGGLSWLVIEKVLGLLMGIGIVFLISATYFFASNSFQRYGAQIQKSLTSKKVRRNRWLIIGKAREGLRHPQRTDNYLRFPFTLVKVENPPQAELRNVVTFLNEHHGKLLLMQIITFVLIGVLGLLDGNPYFHIPAGASFLLMLSLALMIIGAITFWFRKSGVMTLVCVLGLIFIYDSVDFLKEKNQAFGMNYQTEPADYSKQYLAEITSEANYQEDRELTIEILENWKANYQQKYGTHREPKAVFVCTSGGGLRSAFWTFRSLQYLDSLTQGELTDEIRLMTGASGGMFGSVYFRELMFREVTEENIHRSDLLYRDKISQDMLNRISFQYFSDIFLPNRKIKIDGKVYDRETGYSFDHQVGVNLPELKERRLIDYRQAERDALIPQIVLTPTILNQGRKLFISSNPISYLSRKNQITDQYMSKAGGVEFSRFFEKQNADSLFMATALRLNATFPYILPIVKLPSNPPMEVMDAGAIDNYGTQTAVKYLFEFKDWFAENTEQIVFIQIRDNEREDPIQDEHKSLMSKLIAPVNGGYYSMAEAKDMANDYLLEFVREWYKGEVVILPIQYYRESSDNPASLSWHLTAREKRNIQENIFSIENQKVFQAVSELYPPDLLAKKSH
ncbi:MAG: hypothetical protein KDE26_13840 [Bacteroidetes bacterium]|nr:hypothetical protein [Bacteroidota bacterium]MCB0844330.1 hypothetical protein [Bacteroidota bacterium]